MGIPHLIATLEPYAEHGVFRDEQVVIDGPALAYHILHVCRANGISQPSYHVLGKAVIQWLDELEKSASTIQHIYFDGSLPTSKQHVRMERMMKSSSRIEEFFNSNPKGCPPPRPQQAGEADQAPAFDLFEAATPGTKPHPDPAFLVPAVIDAVRSCPRYRDRFSVVPGEADVFCARHVASRGGAVVTSDSDLLAHDLGSGKVVFLREIHRTAEGQLSCLAFTPREIYANIGLPASVEPWRLAYERTQSPNATLSRLVSACSRPVTDAVDYDRFRQQYLHRQDTESLPLLVGGGGGGATPLPLNGLDPRVSELVLQLGGHNNAADASIFLPVLIENPLKGTVWEPSMPTRQLAYSIASWLMNRPPSLPVFEFRRVRQRSQKGRQLTLIPPDAIPSAVSDIILAIQRARRKRSAGDAAPRHWIILAMLLDVAGCEEQGKTSHLLETLRKSYTPSPKSAGRLPWDIAHFAAQVQAGLYSLRILAQILALLPGGCEGAFDGRLWQLRRLLSQSPTLPRFLDTPDIVKVLEPTARGQVLDIIRAMGSVGEDPSDQKAPEEARKARKQNGPREKSLAGTRPSPAVPGRSVKQNIFSLLDVDQ